MSSSTRYRQQPLQIYQDPISYDHAPMPSSSNKASSPLRPLKNASSRRNIVLNPPSAATNKPSPHKSSQHSSSSPSRAPFSNKLNMISMPPPRGPTYHTDSIQKKPPMMSDFRTGPPQKALFATFPPAQNQDKENSYPSGQPSPANYYEHLTTYDRSYGQKNHGKRMLMDAPEIEQKVTKKMKKEQEPTLPPLEQFPKLHDDGSKPGHSYAMLIGMAILRAPNKRLTLAQIYKWISDTYSFYNATDAGWQNSIRHNLSLNKAFMKQERPKDDPGKGNYWVIEAGSEGQFLKEKTTKKSAAASSETGPNLSTIIAPAPPISFTRAIPDPLPPRLSSSAFMPSETIVKPAAEPSSDATIPASDALAAEEELDESYLTMTHPILSSPPPAAMDSSPPLARHDTPPAIRMTTSSSTRHKRKFASMDDSGYISSFSSSALRGGKADRPLPSEADRPRIKRGRAEEEIARLRGSSYDSPTKSRAFVARGASVAPSSSPRRGLVYDSSQMLPPLTPAIKLKPPMRPPPSVSPNTNLQNHRDRVRAMVGSPDRGIESLDDPVFDTVPWSPAFQIDAESGLYHINNVPADFDIFGESSTDFFTVSGDGSPAKRSAKRPRLDRAPHTSNVLTDISNMSHKKNNTLTPMLKFTPLLAPTSAFTSPSKLFSPSKFQSPTLSVSAFDLPQENFVGDEFLVEDLEDLPGSDCGMDILQGFQKIGAGHGRQVLKPSNSRPAFGRSFTSRF